MLPRSVCDDARGAVGVASDEDDPPRSFGSWNASIASKDEPADDDEDLLLALSRRARLGRHGVLPAAVAPVEELSLSVVSGGGATGTIGPS